MNKTETIQLLGALAHETRLDIFRLLVPAGPTGVNAGTIARELNLAAATCSFHLKEMKTSQAVHCERNGRELIYSVNFPSMRDLVSYLTENCCASDNNYGNDPCAWRAMGIET